MDERGNRDEELKRLRDELESLKAQIRELSEGRRKQDEPEGQRESPKEQRDHYGPYVGPDLGERISEYVSGVVDNVVAGITGEMDRSIFIGPGGVRIMKNRRPKPGAIDPKKTATVMSALGNEHRVKILEELTGGGLYASELQEMLPEIGASTLSSHLDVLQEAGLVVQEKARGRYLITMPGRLAIRMASQIARQIDEGSYTF